MTTDCNQTIRAVRVNRFSMMLATKYGFNFVAIDMTMECRPLLCSKLLFQKKRLMNCIDVIKGSVM